LIDEGTERPMVIVDSSVWINAFRSSITPQTSWLIAAMSEKQIGLTSLILCEVLRGVRFDWQFRETEQKLLSLVVFERTSAALAVAAAQNFRTLQRRGITVRKTVDCLIATFCIEEGHELLHQDSDFDGFEEHLGLRVIHPETR
jgi:predicted nucleic acid-binding protein